MSKAFGRLGSIVPKVVNTVPARQVSYSQLKPLNVPTYIRKWAYNLSGFNQYGLYKNDILMEAGDVIEALKRLPPQLKDERTFRLQRASQLSLMNTVLPKDQWITFEEDMEKGRYLEPYLEEIERERNEKALWGKR